MSAQRAATWQAWFCSQWDGNQNGATIAMNTIGQAEAGPSERTSHPNETGPSNHASTTPQPRRRAAPRNPAVPCRTWEVPPSTEYRIVSLPPTPWQVLGTGPELFWIYGAGVWAGPAPRAALARERVLPLALTAAHGLVGGTVLLPPFAALPFVPPHRRTPPLCFAALPESHTLRIYAPSWNSCKGP